MNALYFVILIGIVSLCADATYEGGRSIAGAYLGFLGANATIVGMVSGVGELVGFALRLGSGYLSDKTQQYWFLTTLGFIINTGAIPLLALTNNWQSAALLFVLERAGRAVRSPPRDVLLSQGAKSIGSGLGFGIHEALDQIGAVGGPLLVSGVLLWRNSYQTAFALLAIPCILGTGLLLWLQRRYPNPELFEAEPPTEQNAPLTTQFWLYLIGCGFIAIGYIDFPLIAFHFKEKQLLSLDRIPLIYAIAMATDALSALGLGVLLDQAHSRGLPKSRVMAGAVAISAGAVPIVFLGKGGFLLMGMALWGIGMGAQESIMKAIVAIMIPSQQRGRAFGIFYVVFGAAWLIGSSVMGFLYESSLLGLVLLSTITQGIAILFLVGLKR